MTDKEKEQGNPNPDEANLPKLPVDDRIHHCQDQEIHPNKPDTGGKQSKRKKNYNLYKWIMAHIKKGKKTDNIAVAAVMINGAMFIITLLYIAYTGQSVKIAQEALKNNNTQFQLSHRPFLQITDISIDSTEEGQKPNIRFNFVNTGQFPAEIVYTSLLMGIGNRGGNKQELIKESETSKYKTQDSTHEILSSGGILDPKVLTWRTRISKDESKWIKDGEYQFFLRVEVKYMDFITKTHYFKVDVFFIDAAPKLNVFIAQSTEVPF